MPGTETGSCGRGGNVCANDVAREAGDVDAVDADGARAEVKHAQEGK